jgi:GntR family transcriptional regulator/MocR family aminotransferase
VLADFIGEGHFARHLRRMRLLYRARRSALVEGLRRSFGARLRVVGAEAGMHLVALRDRPGDRAIALRASREGLWAMPLSACYLARPALHGLVLGYGGTSVEQMPKAVQRLRRVVDAGGG